jgi:hypothetical protein
VESDVIARFILVMCPLLTWGDVQAVEKHELAEQAAKPV